MRQCEKCKFCSVVILVYSLNKLGMCWNWVRLKRNSFSESWLEIVPLCSRLVVAPQLCSFTHFISNLGHLSVLLNNLKNKIWDQVCSLFFSLQKRVIETSFLHKCSFLLNTTWIMRFAYESKTRKDNFLKFIYHFKKRDFSIVS